MLNESLKNKVFGAFCEKRFIGDVHYTEEEYNELLAYTRKFSVSYVHCGGSYLQGDDEIHFATLVEIAKRWKRSVAQDESGFWSFVYDTVGICSEYGRSKIYKAYTEGIASLSNQKKILIADIGKKYYATIMMHAFAPFESMSAFFDFVYNIYKKDLDFFYTETDKDICRIAAEGLCAVLEKLGGKNIDVSIGSGAYGIKIGLRCMALGIETRNDFIDLLDRVFLSINSLYHGNELSENDHLMFLLNEWWKAKAEKDFRDVRHIGSYAPMTKQNITVKFVQNDAEVYLCIPAIRFTIGEDPKLRLFIYYGNDSAPIVSEDMFTKRGEITLTSVQREIELNDLLRDESAIDIRVVITENEINIYEKTIKKDFILFDNGKEFVGKVLKPGNYFVYTACIERLQTPTAISTVTKNLYNIYPAAGEFLSCGQRQVVFVDGGHIGLGFGKVQLIGECGICAWQYREKTCKVFVNRVDLLIPTGISVNSLELRINGSHKLLSEMELVSEDGQNIYDITSLIPQREFCEFVVVSHLKECELIRCNIVLMPKLRIEFSKRLYYGYAEKRVRIDTGTLCEDLTCECVKDTVSCVLYDGRLDITLPQFKWRINMGEWHYGPVRDIVWYKDHFNSGSVLEINTPINFSGIKLYCISDGEVREIAANAMSKYEIGRYIFANEGRKTIAVFAKFFDSSERMEMFETATSEYFTQEPPFIVDGDKLRFIGDGSFIGEKNATFDICLKRIGRDEIKFNSDDLINGILEDVDEGIYWIKVGILSKHLFTAKEKILWEGEYVFGDRDKLRLNAMVLKINPICGVGGGDFWKSSSRGYYITELVREDDPDTYIAKIYYKNLRGEKEDVFGFSDCRINIISPIALSLCVKDIEGNYTERLKCDGNGNLYAPHEQQTFDAINYHFIEVENV